ncbi:MAG: hypothetical protein M3Q29_24990 [Chloroflexota bacterium]|nr:hypothetical protein [Chloroflexota bacterium]
MWLLLKPVDDLPADDQHLLDVLLQEPSTATSYPLAQRFVRLVRERDLAAPDAGIADGVACQVLDLANFAAGSLQDAAAVWGALTLPWSTGPVEGQSTRLKLLER